MHDERPASGQIHQFTLQTFSNGTTSKEPLDCMQK
jgi:hypothetical protein